MKKILMGMAVMLWIVPAMAQTATQPAPRQKTSIAPAARKSLPPPEQRALPYANELKKKLALTDDQYKKVLAVNAECIRRKDALKAAGQPMDKGGRDISDYRKQQYNLILTPAQQVKLKAMNERALGSKHEKSAPVTDGSISE